MGERFLTLDEVGEVLSISKAQTYALVRSLELPAIKLGGRGVWRVERTALEDFIKRMYLETKTSLQLEPLQAEAPLPED